MAIFRRSAVFVIALILAVGARAAESKVRVLIVDGFSNHDWALTTALIRGVLEPTGLFEVSVSTSPPTADAPGWDAWRPDFRAHEVVIQNCNDIRGGPSWPREVQMALEAFVRSGGGLLAFHSANNAFPDWPAYNAMIGLGWRKKEQGTAIAIDPARGGEGGALVRIAPGEGRDTGHGPRGDVVITRRGEHPIHAGLPRRWRTPSLEIYFYARGPAENLNVLSYAFDARTDMHWPIEWTVDYGEGRVYNATFGHVWRGDLHPASMRCAGVQTILVRAVQWLAKREPDFPAPADFPGENEVSIRAPAAQSAGVF